MNLPPERHVFDALFPVTDPTTATEALVTAITAELDEHCPMRSVKMSSIDPTYLSPLLKILLQKKYKQKSDSGTQKLKETEKRIQSTNIANTECAKNKPGSDFGGRQPIVCSGR